ncbi:Smr/MutS family protein [Thermocrispum municipale]|jgi:DNA-nicking Smr family endonuclease|uniref:Smr/MutS family protein n=1 Tax=Thermocrispum municipale TaxID=37926 RepID=UPI00041C4055|nr:Smr/MutS family protein [Thermocrispum municipale]
MPEKLTVDLHPVFRSDRDIDRAVRQIIFRAKQGKVPLAEIIVGKGDGKLQHRVMRMLGAKHMKNLYRSAEIDPENAGRILVHF